MRFNLIDRIVAVEPGRRLKAVKYLTLGEEYLADHFPTFPVMPGVLMLQAVAEAGSWLLRLTDDFAQAVIVLREAKSVKYGTFMQPGHCLEVTAELVKRDGPLATVRGTGTTGGQQAVSAQIGLAGYNLRDRDPALAGRDAELVRHWRERAALLQGVAGGSA